MIDRRFSPIACRIIMLTIAIGAAAAEEAPLPASKDLQWTRSHAAHLLRRAGFGGTPEQAAHLLRLGRDAAVDLLVDYDRTPQEDPGYPLDAFVATPPRGVFAGLNESQRQELKRVILAVGVANANAVREWWLRRMVITARPLEEKMTLFWHGHFTSGLREVKSPQLLYRQNEFLRANALGNFKALVKGISRDPAMLIYLDNASNVKNQPNENYARELMELFTLGEGNYTEQDVREAARAFTGWTIRFRGGKRVRAAGDGAQQDVFMVRRDQHDDGAKTFLGHTGNFDGDDVIDIIFEQPAISRFLARKLWTFFVEPNPEAQAIEAFAEVIRRNQFDLKESMRTLFRSDAFYSPRARFALVKSPTELVVGTFRLLEVPPGNLRGAAQAMTQMGQELLQPPNVRGWVGGRSWINTSTLFARYNAVAGLVYGSGGRQFKPLNLLENRLARLVREREPVADAGMQSQEMNTAMSGIMADLPEQAKTWLDKIQAPPQFSSPQPAYDPRAVLEKHRLRTPEAIVDHYVDRLLQSPLPRDRRSVLVRSLAPDGMRFDPTSEEGIRRIRALIHLIASTPEYQLN